MCGWHKKHDRRKQQKGWLCGEAKKTGGVWLNTIKIIQLI
jgi:hypothetical protein